jgi:glycine dehydrogenase subunit 1
MGAMHMSLLGPEGLHDLAVRNMSACTLGKQKLSAIQGVHLPHASSHHFQEFVVELPGPASECLAYLDSVGIVGGFDLARWYPSQPNWLLVSFTDQTQAKDVDLLASHIELWTASQGVAA